MNSETAVPLHTPRIPSHRPGPGRAMGAIWQLVWRTRLTLRRLPKIAILTSSPAILVISTTSRGETGSYLSIAVNFYLLMVVPLVCLLNMASPVRDETERGTISYLATRPLPRSLFFLLLHGCHLLWLQIVFLATGLLLLASGFWIGIPSIASMIAPFLLAQAGAVIAYSGMSALAGLLTRRYLVIGLLYGAIIEFGVGEIPTNINALSMSHHVRVIVSIFEPAADFLRTNEGHPAVSGTILVAVGIIGALIAVLIYRTREFTGGPDS